jgi:hypothetical protein
VRASWQSHEPAPAQAGVGRVQRLDSRRPAGRALRRVRR